MMTRTDSRRGVAMIIALIVIMIIGGTAAAFLILMIELNEETELRKSRIKALLAAEVGIKQVWDEMNDEAYDEAEQGGTFDISTGDVRQVDLGWGRYDVTITEIAGTDDWRIVSTGTVSGPRGDTVREVEVELAANYASTNSEFGWAIWSEQDMVLTEPLMTDSFDSSAATYNPTLPAGSGLTTPWDGSGGDVGSNGLIGLSNPSNEVHGTVKSDAGFSPAPAGFVSGGTDSLPAGGVSMPPTDPAEVTTAQTVNDNASITGIDPFGFPYLDPAFNDLLVFGGTCNIGDPGGTPHTYYFNSVTTMAGGVINIQGPVTIYLGGDWDDDESDGIPNITSSVSSDNVLIYAGAGCQTVQIDGDATFGAGIYAPTASIDFVGTADIIGSYVCRIPLRTTGQLSIHWDEALGRVGSTSPTTTVVDFSALSWFER